MSMRVSLAELRLLITHQLHERVLRDAPLSTGGETPYGSPDHIVDMQQILAGLEALKKGQKYGSANRAVFSDAGRRLRRILSRAQATVEPVAAPMGEPIIVDNTRQGEH